MDYTDVIPNPDPVRAYAHEVVALLNHVEAVEDEIGALMGDSERSTNAQISDRHREVGSSLKVADIYSNLAIAEAIDNLRIALDRDPIPYPPESFLSATIEGDPHRC